MAVKLADAVVYLTTDNSKLDSGLAEGEQKAQSWGGRLGGFFTGIAQGIGQNVAGLALNAVQSVGQFVSGSIGAASDMNETISKTGVLFGDSAQDILDWASTASTALGQSKQQALDAAANFAIFGKSAGLSGADLTKFSTDFTGLASDLASFNNTTPEQAINAIGAALRGESEPLRQYGILLDENTLKNEALKLGLIATTKDALTPQQKILAAQAAIYAQTSAAQGDFARTSDGLANQQRILDAQMTNLKATVGAALLPVVLVLTSALNSLATTVLPPLADFITTTVVPAMTVLASSVQTAINFVSGLFSGGLVDSVGQGSAVFGALKQRVDEIMPYVQEIITTVLGAIQTFWTAHGETIMHLVGNTFTVISTAITTTMDVILQTIKLVLQLITGDWAGAGNTIKSIVSTLWDGLKTIFSVQLDSIRTLTSGFIDAFKNLFAVDFGGAIDGATEAMSGFAGWVSTNMPSIQSIVEGAMNGIAAVWEANSESISVITDTTWGNIQIIIQTTLDVINGLVTAFWQILNGDFEGAGQTLNGVVERIFGGIHDIFSNSLDGLSDLLGGFDLADAGRKVIDSLQSGIEDKWGDLTSWFSDKLEGLRDMLPFSEPKDPASPLRGLSRAGAGIVEQVQKGLGEATFNSDFLRPVASAATGRVGAINVVQNFYGPTSEATVERASRNGLTQALRSVGVHT